MPYRLLILAFVAFTAASCQVRACDSNQAMNKVLALGKAQGRFIAQHGNALTELTSQMTLEISPIHELIAQEKFDEACKRADELAAKYGIDLTKEQKDMITIEQLAKDGGKGSGTSSLADAAKKQMEVHGLLQADVDAGRRSSEIFRQFNEDTVGLAEMYSTNPSKACELLENLRVKYNLS